MSRLAFNRRVDGTARRKLRGPFGEPTCVYCGCTQRLPCVTALGPCAWLTLNRRTRAGVCSACYSAPPRPRGRR